MKIEARVDELKKIIQESRFLEMKGLGNEVPFYIFDYMPEKELFIRNSVESIIKSLEKKEIKILNVNLYDLILKILLDKINLDKIVDFEKKKGSDELLEKLRPVLKIELINEKILELLSKDNYKLIFLTGIGTAWPLIRSHKILNNLQTILKNIPLIIFYPGKYSKYDLSLFDKFKDTNYYRAFRLADYDERLI